MASTLRALKRALRHALTRESGLVLNYLDEATLRKQFPELDGAQARSLHKRVSDMVAKLVIAGQPRGGAGSPDFFACLRNAAELLTKAVQLARDQGVENAETRAKEFAATCCTASDLEDETQACQTSADEFLTSVAACLRDEHLSAEQMHRLLRLVFSPNLVVQYRNLIFLAAGMASLWLLRHARTESRHLQEQLTNLQESDRTLAKDVGAMLGDLEKLRAGIAEQGDISTELKDKLQALGKEAAAQATPMSSRIWEVVSRFLPTSLEGFAYSASKAAEAALYWQGAGAIGDVRSWGSGRANAGGA